MTEKLDLFTRAAAIVDAYRSKHGWPSMQEAEEFHGALIDLRDVYGESYDAAEGFVHDTATNLGWTIAMVDGRIEKLVRPGTSQLSPYRKNAVQTGSWVKSLPGR